MASTNPKPSTKPSTMNPRADLRVPHQGGVRRGDNHGALKSDLVLCCLNTPRARICATGPPWHPNQPYFGHAYNAWLLLQQHMCNTA